MDEKELSKLVSLQQVLTAQFQEDAAIVNDAEKMAALDGLNRDLLITRANGINTLLGVIQITIGLNITQMRDAANKDANNNPETPNPAPEAAPANEEETAQESPKQE